MYFVFAQPVTKTMFSPVFFEKQDRFIERLDKIADLAHEYSFEIGIEPMHVEDLTPVCSKCLKRRKLNFEGCFAKSPKMSLPTDDVIKHEYHSSAKEARESPSLDPNVEDRNSFKLRKPMLSPATSPICDVTMSTPKSNSKFRRRYKSDADTAFMSTMLKALVALNSPREMLDLYCNTNETPNKKKAWFKRRHTTILQQNTSELPNRLNAAVSVISPSLQKHKHVSSTGSRRVKCARKSRPMSFPSNLQRVATSPSLLTNVAAAKDVAADLSQLDDTDKNPAVLTKGDVEISKTNAAGETGSRICRLSGNFMTPSHSKDASEEKGIQIETTVAAKGPTQNALHIYYSLSPAMWNSPLKLEHLKDCNACRERGMTSWDSDDRELKVEDLNNETSECFHAEGSSMHSNPEYFDIITKSGKNSEILRGNECSLPAKVSSAVECDNFDAERFHKASGDNSEIGDSNVITDENSSFCNNDEMPHGEGLLYTSSFGIGGHGWRSTISDGDIIEDGYCKCSFCNHDVIVTPIKGNVVGTPLKVADIDKDFSVAHEELLRLSSTIVHDDSIVSSLRTSQYPVRDYFRRESVSYDSENVASQLDVNWDLPCTEEEISLDESNAAMRVSETRKALQHDIEKHSSGVSSVLELCDVLLHDVDAYSNQSEKTSIEKASESLDRRWRNICSLSVERKLKIEETQRLWKKFMEDYSRFSDWLRSAERVVTYPHSNMVPHKVAKEELKKYETFQRQVQESLTQLELINKQYRKLARESRTDATTKLKDMIHDGNSRWDAISHRVTSILRRLKHAIHRREDFESQRQELVVWLTEIDLRLTNVEHLSQRRNFEKLTEIRTFQATVEAHIPQIIDLHQKGQRVLEASEAQECVVIEEELTDLQRYCREVLCRLDKYHRKLLKVMNEPSYRDSTLFDDTELTQLSWWEKPDSGDSRPGTPEGELQSAMKPEPSPRTHVKRSRDPSGSHSGRATPESLEWDLYDISHSELSIKDNGVLTDDASIPEISPLEMDDEVPLLHVSRDSNMSSLQNVSGSSQGSQELSIHGETPTKKPRMAGNDRKSQFSKDLAETLAWCEATEKVTDQEMSRSGSKFEKTMEELKHELRELKGLESSIEEKRATVLSINVTSSTYAGAAEKQRLEKLNADWESLQQKSADWTKSLQESLAHSQDFRGTLTGISTWVDEQNSKRGDITMIQQKETYDSMMKLQELRKGYKSLEQMNSNTLDAIKEVSGMQEMCTHLTSSGDSRNNGVRAVSTKVQSTNGRLKALLDAVRSDLRDMERRVKAARRKVRGEKASGSDSSDDSCNSDDSMRFKMLERKVDASELHSSGRANDNDKMNVSKTPVKRHGSDIVEKSYSTGHTSIFLPYKDRHSLNYGVGRRRINVVTEHTVISEEKSSSISSKSAEPVMAGSGTAVLPSNRRATPLCRRIFLAALPFYILFALLFLLWWILGPVSDDGLGCLRQNNYVFSLTPMLSYTNGPPPV